MRSRTQFNSLINTVTVKATLPANYFNIIAIKKYGNANFDKSCKKWRFSGDVRTLTKSVLIKTTPGFQLFITALTAVTAVSRAVTPSDCCVSRRMTNVVHDISYNVTVIIIFNVTTSVVIIQHT